jgi:hypothetical protein
MNNKEIMEVNLTSLERWLLWKLHKYNELTDADIK